jgi:hypothetical protein
MNAAAHGIEVDPNDARDAELIGAEFLAEIKRLSGE